MVLANRATAYARSPLPATQTASPCSAQWPGGEDTADSDCDFYRRLRPRRSRPGLDAQGCRWPPDRDRRRRRPRHPLAATAGHRSRPRTKPPPEVARREAGHARDRRGVRGGRSGAVLSRAQRVSASREWARVIPRHRPERPGRGDQSQGGGYEAHRTGNRERHQEPRKASRMASTPAGSSIRHLTSRAPSTHGAGRARSRRRRFPLAPPPTDVGRVVGGMSPP